MDELNNHREFELIDAVKISRILHAGYIFEYGENRIIFDPIFENPFSRNCYAYPDVKFDHDAIRKLKFDAIFISHFHDDHCSFESLHLLDRSIPIYVYCIFDELFSLIRELGFTNVYSLKVDELVKIGSFEVIPRRALDSDIDSIFHVKASGLNILNVVDALIEAEEMEQLKKYGPWDLVLWPFQTMLETDVIAPSRAQTTTQEVPAEFIEQLRLLNSRYIVPSSCQFIQEKWSWYNHALFPISYQKFHQQIEDELPNSKVVRLNPSVSILLDKNSLKISSPLMWIQPIGEQNVDYEYDEKLGPSTTKEISQKFSPLSDDQKNIVYNYCITGLPEKYNLLGSSEDMYFSKPRIWRLSVYDHRGDVVEFYYQIEKHKLSLLSEKFVRVEWVTEVSIAKIYAALELGESLTSMYLRVNDCVFDPEIEKEIKFVDIVDDPLIRCLFNGVFGAYQVAQLKRLGIRQG